MNPTWPTLMHEEAEEAPAAVTRLFMSQYEVFAGIAERLRAMPVSLLITNARGSSDHASVFGKYLLMQRCGIPVLSGQPSLASIYARPLKVKRAALISVSQSGQSPDIVDTAKSYAESGALTIAMTNTVGSPLAQCSDHTIDLCAGQEKSVAATKSFIASLAAYLSLVAHWVDDELLAVMNELPDILTSVLKLDWSDALQVLENSVGLFVIGRGPGLGIASEAALKFKETCQIHAEAFSSAECSHGPLAMVGPTFPVLLFVQDDAAKEGTVALGRRMVELGAPVLVAGAEIQGAIQLPTLNIHPLFQPVALIQTFYKMVADLALRRGQNPDSPPALRKVTETR